jgi:prephenate dehydratase
VYILEGEIVKIAFLGPVATFTDLAVRQLFPKEDAIPFVTIPECIDAAAAGDADFAVVPVENASSMKCHYLLSERLLLQLNSI